jgi:hypothetical protein
MTEYRYLVELCMDGCHLISEIERRGNPNESTNVKFPNTLNESNAKLPGIPWIKRLVMSKE